MEFADSANKTFMVGSAAKELSCGTLLYLQSCVASGTSPIQLS